MSHTVNLTHFAPTGRSKLGSIFSLIGPALRIARAVENGTKPANADLAALGVGPAAFERILSAQRGLPAGE